VNKVFRSRAASFALRKQNYPKRSEPCGSDTFSRRELLWILWRRRCCVSPTSATQQPAWGLECSRRNRRRAPKPLRLLRHGSVKLGRHAIEERFMRAMENRPRSGGAEGARRENRFPQFSSTTGTGITLGADCAFFTRSSSPSHFRKAHHPTHTQSCIYTVAGKFTAASGAL
jgi:hypothetical protein